MHHCQNTIRRKKHEEIIRGLISEIISIVEELKGEMVIVVEGSQEVEEEITFETTIKEDVDMYIEKGMVFFVSRETKDKIIYLWYTISRRNKEICIVNKATIMVDMEAKED